MKITLSELKQIIRQEIRRNNGHKKIIKEEIAPFVIKKSFGKTIEVLVDDFKEKMFDAEAGLVSKPMREFFLDLIENRKKPIDEKKLADFLYDNLYSKIDEKHVRGEEYTIIYDNKLPLFNCKFGYEITDGYDFEFNDENIKKFLLEFLPELVKKNILKINT